MPPPEHQTQDLTLPTVSHQIVHLIVDGKHRWFDPSYGVEYEGGDAHEFAPSRDLMLADFEDQALAGVGSVQDTGDTIVFIETTLPINTKALPSLYTELPPTGYPD